MKNIKQYLKKGLLTVLTVLITLTLLPLNSKESLIVSAEETGSYYGETINKESQAQTNNDNQNNPPEPELKEVEKDSFEELYLAGYKEDLSQREESLKVFVNGDTEKRLYFLSPVHVFHNGEWLEESELPPPPLTRFRQVIRKDVVELTTDGQVLVQIDTSGFSDVSEDSFGFSGKKEISADEVIPFSLGNGVSAELNESKTALLLTSTTNNEVLGTLNINIEEENYINTSYTPELELHTIDSRTYGISLSGIMPLAAKFDIDLQGSTTKTYNSSSVYLFGVRSGSSFKSHSYNPGGYIGSVNNVVIGNANYNGGYVFCAGSCVTESQNNYGIISFYNGTPLKNVIGANRTISSAKLYMTYNTHPNAQDNRGIVYQTYMLDPSKNFDVANVNNITYDNFQTYLSNSATPMAMGPGATATGYKGILTLDITEILQSWENSGNHHGIWIKGESKENGTFLEASHLFFNHTDSYLSDRPYIEITTIKEEPISDDLSLDATTLFIRPFTVNSRANNVIHFSALGFDGVTKPGSSVKVTIKDDKGTEIYSDINSAADGYRRFPQYTSQLGYNFPDGVQTYYRLTSNYQLKNVLYNNKLEYNKLYKTSYQSSFGGQVSQERNSDEFIIYKVTAYDRLPRLLAFYGITNKVQFMQDNNMSDELLVEGNVLFIRNPLKNKDKVYQPAELDDNDKRMIDNNLLGRNQHCYYGYEPINFNTGNFIYSNSDTGSIDYDKEILFERTYNSLAKEKIGIFGRNWTLSLVKELYFLSNGSIEYSDGSGRIYTFEKSGSGYKIPFDSNYQLERYELRREKITVDNGYYDMKDSARTTTKEIIHYGYRIIDSNTQETIEFDEVGNVTSYKRNQYELPIKYEYQNYNLSAIITPAGRRFTIKLNDLGLISSITDPEGNKTTYGYDSNMNLVTFNDQMGYTIKYTYDSKSRMLSYTGREKDDIVVTNTYDEQGRVISQIDALGQESTFNYYSDYTEITNFKGNVTKIYKDSHGYTAKVIEEDLNEQAKTYDTRGNLVKEVKANGTTLTYKYDENNRLQLETNQFDQSKSYEYDSHGNVSRITDFNGEVTTFTYDSNNRLIGSYYPNGTSEIVKYNEANQISYKKDIYGLEKTYSYKNGSLVKVTDNVGGEQSYTYTLLGNLESETNAVGHTTKYVYDKRSQLTEVQYPNHREVAVYDGDGQKVSVVDGNGNRTNFTYDGWSRITSVTDAGGTTYYAYDENGNVVKVTDALGYSDEYKYDIHNRLVKHIDKLGRVSEYKYDTSGNLIETINKAGQVKTFEYNELNQLIKESFIEQLQQYEYDDYGNLIRVLTPYGDELSYKYDINGLLIETTDEAGFVTKYSYEGTRLISKEYKGLVWEYTYDVKGNVVEELDPLQRLTSKTYTKVGQISSTNLGQIVKIRSSFDGEGRLQSVTDAKGNSKYYLYDGNGNIIKETDENGNSKSYKYDHHNNVTEVLSAAGYRYEYTYDALGQLVKTSSYDVINDTVITYEYKYNEIGNLISETDSLGRVTKYEYDVLDQLISIDNNGRKASMEYDEYGRVVKETSILSEITYSYDERGLLVATEDSLGYKQLFTYNELKQLVQSENELAQIEKFTYNELGYLSSTIDYRGRVNQIITNELNETVKSIDPLGVETTYEYNEMGQLISTKQGSVVYNVTIDVTGHVATEETNATAKVEYLYDKNGNITEIKQGTHHDKKVYDKENRLIEIIDTLGNSTKYRYNILNQVVEITYADGTTDQYQYDNAGRMILAIDELGFATQYQYDEFDNLVVLTNALGHQTKYQYDEKDNLIKVIEPLKRVTSFEYDERNRQVKVVSPNGNIMETTYNIFDEVESITYPNGLVMEYQYNEYNELTSVGYKGYPAETVYEYDEYGRIASKTDKFGNKVILQYDSYGNIIETSVNEQTLETIFDEFNRVVKTIDDRGYETSYSYNEYNQQASKEDNLGYKESYIYNAQGQLVGIETGLGITEYEYDSLGQIVKATLPNGASTSYVYDERNNQTEIKDSLGNSTKYDYDELGRVIKETDSRGHTKVYEYNALNEVVSFQEDSGRVMHYTYDLEGNLLEVKYKDNRVQKRSYDNMNRLTSITDIDNTKDTYEYDELGNVIKTVLTNKETTYQYNELSLLTSKTVGSINYEYEYNNWGQLTKATKDGKITEITYGDTQEIKEVLDENGQLVSYEYDIKGRQTVKNYPDGKQVEYSYDEYDRLVMVVDGEDKTVYEYDNVGNLITETTGELITVRDYDLLGNITSQEVTKADEVISSISYLRNELGDVTEEVTVIEGKVVTKSYTYDEANQLSTMIVEDENGVSNTSYTYDMWGNKDTVIEEENGEVRESRYLYNESKQLIKIRSNDGNINIKYDDYGNVTEKSYSNGLVESYSFDDNNQLIEITDNYGKEVEYSYDALDERVSKKESLPYNYLVVKPEDNEEEIEYDLDKIFTEAETTVLKVLDDQYYCTISSEGANIRISTETYVNDLSEEYTKVLQTNRNEEVYESYTYGITQLKTERGEEEHYHVVNGKLDIIGSISESVSTWYDYGVSGNVLTDTAPRFGYSSESHEGSLQYLRARYYDTETGIFLSQDSYRGTVTNQLSQNRYIYTENNAVNRIDPSGHILKWLGSVGKEVGKFVGGVVDKGTRAVKNGINAIVDVGKTVWNTGTKLLRDGANAIITGGQNIIKGLVNTVDKVLINPLVQNHQYQAERSQAILSRDYEKILTYEIADLTASLRISGASEEEIELKKLELIQKYCEKFDLDVVEFSESQSFQDKLNATLEKQLKVQAAGKEVKDTLVGMVTAPIKAVEQVGHGLGTLGNAFEQALQGNWEEAGKLTLKGLGDIAGGGATIALTVGSIALAVSTGGASLAATQSALTVAGTAFGFAKGAALTEAGIGGAEIVVGSLTNDEEYMMEGGSDLISGLLKASAANKGIKKVDTKQEAIDEYLRQEHLREQAIIRERVLKNLEESRKARASSGYKEYLEGERIKGLSKIEKAKLSGSFGEKELMSIVDGQAQVPFNTSDGSRVVDVLSKEIAHEAKTGYQSLTQTIKRQINKDVELIENDRITGSTWHFFRSPVTGRVGASKNLLEYLEESGINVEIHK